MGKSEAVPVTTHQPFASVGIKAFDDESSVLMVLSSMRSQLRTSKIAGNKA
jgi:hypothetical protein